MHLPYTFLAVAVVLWGASRAVAPPPPVSSDDVPSLGIAGSAYGSLIARIMREPLYAYWHGGEVSGAAKVSAPARADKPASAEPATPPPSPPAGGVFSRRRLAAQAQEEQKPAVVQTVAVAPQGSALERGAKLLLDLESRRTKRTGQFVTSAAHLRYINASADWRLRLACHLDPGDAALYEILHAQIIYRSTSQAEAQAGVRDLARRAIARALSRDAGLQDSLTGAGASLNLLNDALLSSREGQHVQGTITSSWNTLEACFQRYRDVRLAADTEGWWQGIPEMRRQEIEDHARFLERLRVKFRDHLAAKGIIASSGVTR